MATASPLDESRLSSEVIYRAARAMERVERGNTEVLTSPSVGDTPDSTLQTWVEEILASLDLTPKLREIEDEQMEKMGPRSVAIPWDERRASLLDYYQRHNGGGDRGFHVPSPLIIGHSRLRPVSLETASDKLISRSNSGFPYLARKGGVRNAALQDYTQDLGAFPCILFTRTQEESKTRNIWGYPISDTLAESRFFIPWLDVEKGLDWRAALRGPSFVDREISDLVLHGRPDAILYCVDFSQFDASVSRVLQDVFFETLIGHFQPDYSDEIRELGARFNTIPILTPDGVYHGEHGVPSGSTFTNSVDSFAQYGLAVHHAMRSQVQGDDGVHLMWKGAVSGFEREMEEAGLVLNQDKSFLSEGGEAIYLQRYYHPNYPSRDYGPGRLGGVYPLHRALGRIKYLERRTNIDELSGQDYYSLRTISILENCAHHPGFVPFVKLIRSLDRDHLSFTEAGRRAYELHQRQEVRGGALFGHDIKIGLSAFHTVKVLKDISSGSA